jgi:hypothetical protein
VQRRPSHRAIEPRARFVRASYFLPFFVVFFEEDFLVVDFLPFLAAMALGTSFLLRNVKLESFSVNDFLLA